MYRKILILFFVLLIPLINCSCWDTVDINKKELAVSGILDKRDGRYILWGELSNLSGGKNGGDSDGNNKYTTYQVSGKSFAEMREDLENEIDKPVYLGTVRTTAFTENMAIDGIGEYFYRMRNLQEWRKAQNVIIVSNDPEKFFEANKDSDMSIGNTIEAILSKLLKKGNTIKNSLSEVLNNLSGEHVCFLLPHFVPDQNSIKLDGYSVIRGDTLVSFIPLSDANGIYYLLNDFVISTYSVPFASGEHTATVEIQLKDKKINPSYVNNKIYFNIEFDFFALLKYMDINDGFTEEYQQEVEQNLNGLILEDIEKVVKASQTEPQSDYLKMREHFRIRYPNETENMDWNEEYPNVNFCFNLNIDLVPGREYDYNPDVKWKEDTNE